MKNVLWMVLGLVFVTSGVHAATVSKTDGQDVYVNIGKKTGVQIGTMMNVYRKKEMESEYGSMKFLSLIHI